MKRAAKKTNKASGMDDLISIAEAARLREVSHAAIRGLIDRGRLPVQVIGGRRFVRRSDVRAFKPEKGGRPRKGQQGRKASSLSASALNGFTRLW